MRPSDLPWLPRALQVLDLRRTDRLLLVLPGSPEVTAAVAHVLGSKGELTVLEPRRLVAEAIALALPAAEVLAADLDHGQRLTGFDALLLAPFAPKPRPAMEWARFVAQSLRPGGRFAVDLPSADPWPDLAAAADAEKLPFGASMRSALSGLSEQDLGTALKSAGLRRVDALLGTHLVAFASPFEAAELVGEELKLEADDRVQLGSALSRRCQATAAVELRVLRSAFAGMR